MCSHTVNLSKHSRGQILRLILYTVLGSMKFRDWHNFRGMHFISNFMRLLMTGDSELRSVVFQLSSFLIGCLLEIRD